MSKPWPMVALGEVISKSDEWVNLKADETYREVTVKLWGKGVVQRREVVGAEIAASRRMLVRANQLILSRIDARNGAAGLVPTELDGAVVSNDFPVFNLNTARVEPKYFGWLTKTRDFVELCKAASEGTTNRVRLQEERFFSAPIPLPALPEQKRIVTRLEELSAKVEEARGLREQAVKKAEALWHAALKSILNKGMTDGWAQKQISEVAETNPSKQSISTSSSDMQVSFVPMSAVDDITGTIKRPEIRSLSDVKKGYTYFAEGDVIFARITPCMQNGKSAIAKGLKNGIGFGSTEFHVMRPKSGLLLSEWLYAIVRHKDFKDDAAAHFKGTAGQQRVPQSFLAQKTIPVPPLPDQRRIVAYLDGLQARVDALKRLQSETSTELNAMLPSVLDRAFKGELV